MKVQTNLRAGAKNRGALSGGGTKPQDSVESVEVYVPPVSRCVGI